MAKGNYPAKQGTGLTVGDKATLRGLMESMKDSLRDVLPRHITPERVLKMALVAASRQPKLFECSRESFVKAVLQSAELGLDCSGNLGSAYLVPFFNKKTRMTEATFIPGYRGLIDLARRSGQVARIEAHLIHERDDYSVEFGTEPKLTHIPTLTGDPGPVVAAYMVAELGGGAKQVEVMTRAELDGIKARRQGRRISGRGVTDEGEMQRKSVVRRGVKYLPLSPEKASDLAKALEYDGDIIDAENLAVNARTPEERAADLRHRLAGEKAPAEAEVKAEAESTEEEDKLLARISDYFDRLKATPGEQEEFQRHCVCLDEVAEILKGFKTHASLVAWLELKVQKEQDEKDKQAGLFD